MRRRFYSLLVLVAACAPPPADPGQPHRGVHTGIVIAPVPSAPSASAAAVPALRAEPAFEWLSRFSPEHADAALLFDPARGVRYGGTVTREGGAIYRKIQEVLCEPEDVAALVRQIIGQRRTQSAQGSRCDESPTKVTCFVEGYQDTPDFTLELRRPSSGSYVLETIVAISRGAMTPEAIEKAETDAKGHFRKYAQKRVPCP